VAVSMHVSQAKFLIPIWKTKETIFVGTGHFNLSIQTNGAMILLDAVSR